MTLKRMKNYNFDDRYCADIEGNIYINKQMSDKRPDLQPGKLMKSFINKYGYVEYVLTDKSGKRKHIQAHRIVASLFIPNTLNRKYVNHIDGNKKNNLIENLEWCTASENESHSYQALKKQVWNKGKSLPSGKDYKGKIRPVQCLEPDGITLIKEYFNPKEAEQDGYKLKQISAVCNGNQKTHKGKIWKYIEN